MATDLETRPTSKSATYLQRRFADLCARIRRVDLVTRLLTLVLLILGYALAVGTFDWLVGSSSGIIVTASRWLAFVVFLIAMGYAGLLAIRSFFRSVNPYFVARQLEQTLPNAKNSLINWLDLHDEEIPSAFRKNLSSRAEETMQEADTDQTIKNRTNWWLLGAVGVFSVGLVVLWIDSPGTASSIARGFNPLYEPAVVTRTQIALLQPEGGDAEVSSGQPIVFAARIGGYVPVGSRPDAPQVRFRYQTGENHRTLPMTIGADGLWMALMQSSEVRTGFTYKITAGDAETPEHHIRLKASIHVKQFEISYYHRDYRRLPNRTVVFPNRDAVQPIIHGPPGSEVELIVRTSRPVKNAKVEIVAGKTPPPPIRMLADDPSAFACRWQLDRSGKFRVVFSGNGGEENADRDWRPIEVSTDEPPKVMITEPGKDVSDAENGVLEIAGTASSDVGIKSLTLHLRVLNDPNKPVFPPKPYRPGKSNQLDDGGYPDAIDYRGFIDFQDLKNEKGITWRLAPGTVIEYWLVAGDATDFPSTEGNLGKSLPYKVVLTKAQDPKKSQAQRDQAVKNQAKQEERQDKDHAKKNQDAKNKKSGSKGDSDPQKEHDSVNENKKNIDEKFDRAQKEQKNQKDRGGAKSADQGSAEKKEGPGAGDVNGREKGEPPMGNEDAGSAKPGSEGGAPAGSGQARDHGQKEKSTKDEPPTANAKGIDQQGPEVPNKDQLGAKNPMPPPAGHAKGGMTQDAGAAKSPGEGAGSAASAKPAGIVREPAPTGSWSDLVKLNEQLSSKDAKERESAAATLKEIAKNSDDARKRDAAEESLKQHGRNPKTGKEDKKMPNIFGSSGKSTGIGDDVKAAAANRAFAARIGMMQLADWKKIATPDFLKKAGVSEAEWQRHLKSMQSYDALVRRLNAKLIRDAQKNDLRGNGGASGAQLVEASKQSTDSLDAGGGTAPPDIFEPNRKFSERPMKR